MPRQHGNIPAARGRQPSAATEKLCCLQLHRNNSVALARSQRKTAWHGGCCGYAAPVHVSLPSQLRRRRCHETSVAVVAKDGRQLPGLQLCFGKALPSEKEKAGGRWGKRGRLGGAGRRNSAQRKAGGSAGGMKAGGQDLPPTGSGSWRGWPGSIASHSCYGGRNRCSLSSLISLFSTSFPSRCHSL